MKKIIILSLSALVLASCTADYQCTCTITDTYNGSTDVSTSNTTLIGVSKAQAENSNDCVSYDQTSTDNSGNNEIYKRTCTITKK